MVDTYLDQIVEYPAKAIHKIANDKYCVGLLVNKGFDDITDEDYDKALEKQIFDYQYVDETTTETTAYIWVEMEVNAVENHQIKDVRLYVTISCHKNYMDLNPSIYKGMSGSRRDNIVRYVDRLLNGADIFGIGTLSLVSVRTLSPINGFVSRELTYWVPDFNRFPQVENSL